MDNIQLDHRHHRPQAHSHGLVLLAHNIASPANVGSLFRLADALGISKLYLSGSSPRPPNRKLRLTSRASEKYVPYTWREDPLALIDKLKAEGYTIISLELSSASIDIAHLQVSPGEKVCLVVGAENAGVCAALLARSDKTVHIPMRGYNSSMNLATACAIASYEIIRRYSS